MGTPRFTDPNHPQNWPNRIEITGVTKDSAGAALGNCVVQLFRTSDDQIVEETTSDGSGNYRFLTATPQYKHYVVAYKAGAPDVTGATVNTVVAVAA
jgi:hypothetical protein